MMIFAGMYGYLDSISIEEITQYKKIVWTSYQSCNIKFD
jgi:hypothetical protein